MSVIGVGIFLRFVWLIFSSMIGESLFISIVFLVEFQFVDISVLEKRK